MYAKDPSITWEDVSEIYGDSKWPGPMNSQNPYRPGALYASMIQRIRPYTIRGFLYYQGESDDHRPEIYQKLFTRLISLWRREWEDLTLPFLFVQLPVHQYKKDPDWKNWCLIREAQMNTYLTVRNTGIAFILECGEYNEIHPKEKRPVAHRLALQALHHVYGMSNIKDAFGPMYQSYEYTEGGMKISFSHASEGFKTGQEITGFEVAGIDGEYVPAIAHMEGNHVLLTSDCIEHLYSARYCWSNYCQVAVFGRNGIPLAPFRTHWDR